jgi:precorrin-6B methylase 1
VVVGSGIQIARDLTPAARAAIETADKVYYLVGDFISMGVLRQLNRSAESLHELYEVGRHRLRTYEAIVRRVLSAVRGGLRVCLVMYGHPGVYVYPTHEAIKRARKAGFEAEMLPGISSEAWMYADLGVDPSTNGCLSYEATAFLICKPKFDTSTALVLFQIGMTGDVEHKETYGREGLELLVRYLCKRYGPRHRVIVYEAAQFRFARPKIQRVLLQDVPRAHVTPASTLFIPPLGKPAADRKLLRKFRITRSAPAPTRT